MNTIVLLSGGMDSTTALYWAYEQEDNIVACINFDYGQRGAKRELDAAARVLFELDPTLTMRCKDFRINMFADSALTVRGASLDPEAEHHGLPATFVPGRNLIFIAYAASMAFELGADRIVGGWSAVDTDYPDCSAEFIKTAAQAASLAIKRDLEIMSPLQYLTKAETVTMGEGLGVPWLLTRSCYAGGREPCLKCDSCIKRVEAFLAANVRDPLVEDDKVWEELFHGKYIR